MLTSLFRNLRHTHPHIAPASLPLDPLEPRFLLTAAPRITDVSADNRGQVVITLDQPLKPASVSSKSAAIYTTSKGKDRNAKAAVSYSTTTNQITLATTLPADTPYKIYLNSKLVKGADGQALDGEFKKPGKITGNGIPGGDLLVSAKSPPAAKLVARFSTVLGNIDVRLFSSHTPLTVKNFLRYANSPTSNAAYSYDNSFFHRSVSNFIIQAGGFKVASDNKITIVNQSPAVPNEPNPNNPGNIRGTIAMAKLGNNPNSATNQWFFNLADNRAILDNQNGGFTVFGQITNPAGLAVMDKIAALKTFNLEPSNKNTPFTDTPLTNNGDPAIARGSLDPQQDLVLVKRIATLMTVAPLPK